MDMVTGGPAMKERKTEERDRRGAWHFFFIGDSQLRFMLDNKGLQKEVWCSRWETRVQRGGYLKDICRMVPQERCQKDPEEKRENLPWVIITGGGND